MNQQSPTDKNGTSAKESTGVTAVLDSMIRTTDNKERIAEKPLAEAAPPPTPAKTEAVAIDVRQLSEEPAVTPHLDTAASVGGLPAAPIHIQFSKHANMGRPMWSVAGATALGLPARFLETLDDLKDGDEAGWISTIVKLVEPMCQGAPDEPTVIVSSGADELAAALGLPVHRRGDLPPYGGSIVCEISQTEADLAWLERIRGDRTVHLVLNGEDTDWLAFATPSVLSYTTNRGGLEAIKLAETTGATIAFGVNAEHAPIRATALELALSIRALFRTR